jgi:hypothetical protein
MESFRTDVSVERSTNSLTHKTPVLTVGSCFADAIGSRLKKYKITALVNPFGVIYNPVSIHTLLLKTVANEPVSEHSFVENQGVHVNYYFHSSLFGLSQSELNGRLMNLIGAAHYFLKSAHWIVITYGSSWVYRRKDTGEIVANCHKIPSRQFEKSLLTEKEIVDSFDEMYAAIKRFNPVVRIILTVSPVRHLKDTLELNSVSKAVLRSACHRIATAFQDVEYFAAYEIMMDDLRDYRFYKSDMIHPTEDAEAYIWEKFAERYFDEATKDFIKVWDPLLAALGHRAFHPASEGHQQFLRQTLKKIEMLGDKINVDEEVLFIKQQLI